MSHDLFVLSSGYHLAGLRSFVNLLATFVWCIKAITCLSYFTALNRGPTYRNIHSFVVDDTMACIIFQPLPRRRQKPQLHYPAEPTLFHCLISRTSPSRTFCIKIARFRHMVRPRDPGFSFASRRHSTVIPKSASMQIALRIDASKKGKYPRD